MLQRRPLALPDHPLLHVLRHKRAAARAHRELVEVALDRISRGHMVGPALL